MGDTAQIMITMVIYMVAVIGIGVAFARRANKNSEAYFLGGRTLGPWVTAMSAVRFHEKSKVVMTIAALFILIFFKMVPTTTITISATIITIACIKSEALSARKPPIMV